MGKKIAIPKTLHELQIELGRQVVTDAYYANGLEDELDAMLAMTPEEAYIEATAAWVQANQTPLQALVQLLEKVAEENSEDFRKCLMNAILDDDLVGAFLVMVHPGYFHEVFKAATRQTGQDFTNFLKLLRQLVNAQ